MHFSRVLAGDQVMPHDFTQVSPGAQSAESDILNTATKSVNGSVNGRDDGSVNGCGDIHLLLSSSPTSSLTSSHTAEDEETPGREDLGEEEETGEGICPAHLLRRNTFKLWTAKSGQVVWYNLDRASKAPADARVVILGPVEAQYFWTFLETGDRQETYDARRAFLLAPSGARDEEVYRWYHAGEIKEQERKKREEAERLATEETRQEAARAEEARKVDVRQEIDDLFDTYAMIWAGCRPMDRAREIAHKEIDYRVSRGRVDEVLADMKKAIDDSAEWIAAYKADPAGVEARCAREEADREAKRQAEAAKKARDAERAETIATLLDRWKKATGKNYPDFSITIGYHKLVARLTQEIEEYEARAAANGPTSACSSSPACLPS